MREKKEARRCRKLETKGRMVDGVEVWTAKDQQWYFEAIKAHPASTATRCRQCRQKQKAAKEEQRRWMEKGNKD